MATNNQLNTVTNPSVVFITTVTLSQADIESMNTTGVLLIPAQGANTVVMVHDILNEYIFNTSGYVDGDTPQLQYGSAGADINSRPLLQYANNIFTGPESSFYATNGSDAGGLSTLPPLNVENTGIYISNYSAPYSGGDSTARITITYSVITTTS